VSDNDRGAAGHGDAGAAVRATSPRRPSLPSAQPAEPTSEQRGSAPDRRSATRDGTPVATGRRPGLEVVSVSKSYGGPDVVRDVTFDLPQGEFLTLLGPSGSGKTTTLLMVAGFERPTRGDIRVAGRSILDDPPQRRNFGIVFQSYALFPHMSVVENVEFPLRMRGVPRRDRRARALDMLDKVGLGGLGARRPRELSGGQQQRVAVARALVFDPDALLLDEPLGALDKRLRESMQIEIKSIQRRIGVSVLYVTHDQEEAMMMSDRIAIMRDGRIAQIGAPMELYKHPATPFVANFLGETNLLPCRGAVGDGRYARVVFADGSHGIAAQPPAGAGERGGRLVSVRPEKVRLLPAGEGADTVLDGVVKDLIFVGSYVRVTVQVLGREIIVKAGEAAAALAQSGRAVRIGWHKDDAQVLPEEERAPAIGESASECRHAR
jgi:putative spermidine/putrescine transport system ATP-binding protein